MTSFFEGLTSLHQTYWAIALLASVALMIVFIMTFLGGEGDMDSDVSDFEADDGGVGFQFFTFKNFVAFLTMFGWTGVACLDNGMSNTSTAFFSALAGLVMMAITSALFFWIAKLADSGTLKMKNAIGLIGEVYLPIGANRSSMGKVQIAVQGSLRELSAMTDNNEIIPSGTLVKVLDVVSAEILLVKTIK